MTQFRTILTSLTLMVCCLLHGQSNEDIYWSQFRGPNATGLAPAVSNPPLEFGLTRNLKWESLIPHGSSSPVIWENHLYLTGYLEEKGALLTICFDRENGKILWCDSIFSELIEQFHAISSPAQSTVAADKDGIYVYFASYGVRCYHHDGSVKWERSIPCPQKKKWGHPVSPVVIDDMVLLNLDYGGKNVRSLLALDKQTGEVSWKTLTFKDPPLKHFNAPGFSTPVRYKDQVIIHRSGGVVGYSIHDGRPVWWLPVVTNGISTPLIHNDRIFVTTWVEFQTDHRGDYFDYISFDQFLTNHDKDGNGLIDREEFPEEVMLFGRPEIGTIEGITQSALINFYNRLDSDKNDTINQGEWIKFSNFVSQFVEDVGMLAIKPGKQGELTRKDILWNEVSKSPEVPSPVAIKDCVYMVKDGGWVTCMNAKTGQIHYQERLGGNGACIASPVIGNGHLYISSYNGMIKVIKAGLEPVPVSETKLPGKITATPAIAGDELYVRTSEGLYSFKELR